MENDHYQISILCKSLVYDQLDACMCAIVYGKLVWTVLCAVREIGKTLGL